MFTIRLVAGNGLNTKKGHDLFWFHESGNCGFLDVGVFGLEDVGVALKDLSFAEQRMRAQNTN